MNIDIFNQIPGVKEETRDNSIRLKFGGNLVLPGVDALVKSNDTKSDNYEAR